MDRRALIACALVAGCYWDSTVGHLRAPRDGSVDDVAVDASVDVARDAAPVADPLREMTGLGSSSVVVARDPRALMDRYRIYYAGRDGALWMERRASSSHASVCAVSLGAPEGWTLAGRPGAGDRAPQLVVVLARNGDGRVQLWSRVETDADAPCAAYGPWTPLPESAAAFTTAPSVYQHPIGAQFPGENAYVLAATTEGLAMLRRPGDDAPWEPWETVPGAPADARVLSRPGLLEWGDQLQVWALARTTSGNLRLLHTIYFSSERRWLRAWIDDPLQVDDPPVTAVEARSHFREASKTPQWIAYLGASGRLWTRTFHLEGPDAVWSAWRAQPPPAGGETGAALSGPSLGVWRTLATVAQHDNRVSELVLAAVGLADRRLYVSPLPTSADAFGPWSVAPDPLR